MKPQLFDYELQEGERLLGAYPEYLDEHQVERHIWLDEAYVYFVNKPQQSLLDNVFN